MIDTKIKKSVVHVALKNDGWAFNETKNRYTKKFSGLHFVIRFNLRGRWSNQSYDYLTIHVARDYEHKAWQRRNKVRLNDKLQNNAECAKMIKNLNDRCAKLAVELNEFAREKDESDQREMNLIDELKSWAKHEYNVPAHVTTNHYAYTVTLTFEDHTEVLTLWRTMHEGTEMWEITKSESRYDIANRKRFIV